MPFSVNCGNEIQSDFDFCPECGHSVAHIPAGHSVSASEKVRICPQCKSQVPESLFYCLNCGYLFPDPLNAGKDGYNEYGETRNDKKSKFRKKEKPKIWRNKWVVFFLCLIFGFFGIHRFYEGKIFTGLLFLLTFGFLGFGVFVDLIRIVLKPNPYLAK